MMHPTPVYCDSQSTVFVSRDATSVKRSVWLLRRTNVLREAVDHKDFFFDKVTDEDNCADPLTKSVKRDKLKHVLSHTHGVHTN